MVAQTALILYRWFQNDERRKFNSSFRNTLIHKVYILNINFVLTEPK